MSGLAAALSAAVIISGAVPTIHPREQWHLDVEEARGLTPELITRYRALSEAPQAKVSMRPDLDTLPVDRWRPLVAVYWPAEHVDRAVCIMHHESAGDPTAANPTSSARGLFQILASLWGPIFDVTEAQLYEPATNVELAARIFELQGWHAWEVWTMGRCR